MKCKYCNKKIHKKDLWSENWDTYHAICLLKKRSEEEKLFCLFKTFLKSLKR